MRGLSSHVGAMMDVRRTCKGGQLCTVTEVQMKSLTASYVKRQFQQRHDCSMLYAFKTQTTQRRRGTWACADVVERP